MPTSFSPIDAQYWNAGSANAFQITPEIVEGLYPDVPPVTLAEMQAQLKTLGNTYSALYHFARTYTDFFKYGFSDRDGYLDRSKEYTPAYVAGMIGDRVATDMEILLTSNAQRRLGIGAQRQTLVTDGCLPATSENDHFLPRPIPATLIMADKLAAMALRPAVAADLVLPAAVVSHLQAELVARVIPYAPVALIGVPYSTVNPTNTTSDIFLDDLIAVPHEVGHYLYWNARTPDGRRLALALTEALWDKPRWLRNWLEELFADAYCCLIAGPVAVLNFQNYLQRVSRSRLVFDNGHHPPPALRGFVLTEMLRTLGFVHAADALTVQWTQILGADAKDLHYFQSAGAPESKPAWPELREQLQAAIDVIYGPDFLGVLRNQTGYVTATAPPAVDAIIPWTKDLNAALAPHQVNDLLKSHYWQEWRFFLYYFQIEQPLDQGPAAVADEQIAAVTRVPHLKAWVEGEVCRFGLDESSEIYTAGTTNTWIDAILGAAHDFPTRGAGSPKSLPVSLWMALLEADGWISGPGGPRSGFGG